MEPSERSGERLEPDVGFNEAVGNLRTWSRWKRRRKHRAGSPGGFNSVVSWLRTGRQRDPRDQDHN